MTIWPSPPMSRRWPGRRSDPGCYEKKRDSFLGGAGESVAAPKAPESRAWYPVTGFAPKASMSSAQ